MTRAPRRPIFRAERASPSGLEAGADKEVFMNATATNPQAQIVVLTPTAGSAYGFGWRTMKTYFLDLFLIILILGAVLVPVGMISSLDGHDTPGGVILRIFSFAYWFLLFIPIDFGAAWIFLRAARREKFEVKDMFVIFEGDYVNVVLANLLLLAIIGIGMAFLLVPGIIFACRLAFVRYLVLDRKMDPVTAVKESWRMTRGCAGSIFFMGLLAVPIITAGLLCFGVGVIPALIWIRSGFAAMYLAVSQGEASQAGAAPAADPAGPQAGA
jgi:hypothetical protein